MKEEKKYETLDNVKGQSVYTGDENSEITRIDRQNMYLNKIVKPYLDEIFAHFDEPAILDVGCSDGGNIIRRLNGRNYYSLLGIDRNQSKIDVANKMYGSERHSFLCLDINTDNLNAILLQYLNQRSMTGFDIIHISSVLLHVGNPMCILENLRCFLTENGRIFIQDEDDGLNMIYPYDKRFYDCMYVWEHSLEAGDRKMGRKVPYYLSSCGYSEINILSTNISSLDFCGEMKDSLWDMYLNSDLWAANDVSFYDTPDAYERYIEYKKEYSRFHENYIRGHYFIMLGFVFITAKK
jgi:2-polyprenyl-3-methyl-5-hydroxy-6-metoxy-1,4-benzoquinol methylase